MKKPPEPDRYDIAAAQATSARDHGLWAVRMARAYLLAGDKSKPAVEGFDLLFDALDYEDRDHAILTLLLRGAQGENVQARATELLDAMTTSIGDYLADKAADAYELACEIPLGADL